MIRRAQLLLCLAVGCGGTSSSDDGGNSATSGLQPTTAGSSSSRGETTVQTSGGSASTSGPSTATLSASGTTASDTTAAASSSSGEEPRFDLPDPDVPACKGGGSRVLDFSYIWVANSSQGTVSKIDTQSMQEIGRYIARPDSAGNPSRTSVSLTGDVAVANRAGGISKFYARTEDCLESNGTPGIQTSMGADDILPWDQEECRAWYTPIDGNAQRPVAWTSGTFSEETCAYEDQAVWTTAATVNSPGSIEVLRLDGLTGVVDVTVPVPELGVGWAGPYGGAVDAENNFWFHCREAGTPHPLVRVAADGSGYEIFDVPDPVNPYGITIDSSGRVWLAGYQGGIGRFDPVTATWDTVAGVTGLGIQEDAFGRMWMAIYPWAQTGVIAFDVDTMAVLDTIDMTGVASSSRGVSIDFEGNVWMVEDGAQAFRIDPDSGEFEVYAGLTGAYTYSDMTGWGLSLVTPG